jgi:hypothetical protein
MTFSFIAAMDPAGPAAAICGITWTLMMPTSGVSALAAAVLCPFRKTARQAYRLSKVAIWSGALAVLAAVVAMVGTAGWKNSDLLASVLLGVATGLPPLVGVVTAFISRRKLTSEVQEFSNARPDEATKAPGQPA